MDLSAADFDRLDAYEEIERGVYERTCVEVETWGCGPRSARVHALAYVGGTHLAQLQGTAKAQPSPSSAA
jgi:hypothetical protein